MDELSWEQGRHFQVKERVGARGHGRPAYFFIFLFLHCRRELLSVCLGYKGESRLVF